MNRRPAFHAQPARQSWPRLADDDDAAPLEPWALDEVDSDFAALSAPLEAQHDAAFE